MNKIRNLMLIMASVALLMGACRKPEAPSNFQLAAGEWTVENVIANGEVNNVFVVNSILHLDNNDTYLFVDPNGRANSGTWAATDSTLVLKMAANDSLTFSIVNLTWEKMHIYRDFQVMSQPVELRYMFRRRR